MNERKNDALPVIAVAMGDPSGISPELTARILSEIDLRRAARYVVFGDKRLLDLGVADGGADPQVQVVKDGDALLLERTDVGSPGIGLAAIQVGVPKRVIVMDLSGPDEEKAPRYFVNPEILTASDETLPYEEGCLSIPGERYPLRRAERAVLRATDLDGAEYEIDAHGWLARIFQHEYDHLDGVLYADRLVAVSAHSMAKVIKKAVLYGRKAGDDKRQDYLTVTLEEVMVSGWSTSASDGSGIPMLAVNFSFSKIEYKYCVQKPDQTLDSPLMTTYDLKTAKK